MTKEFVYFMTPGQVFLFWNMDIHIENAMFGFIFLSTCGQESEYRVLIRKEGSTIIVNFLKPEAGIPMLRCGHISHYSEYALSSALSIYNTLFAIVLKNYNADFLCNC